MTPRRLSASIHSRSYQACSLTTKIGPVSVSSLIVVLLVVGDTPLSTVTILYLARSCEQPAIAITARTSARRSVKTRESFRITEGSPDQIVWEGVIEVFAACRCPKDGVNQYVTFSSSCSGV